jgi:DNA-binding transcriptional MerR regulator
VRPIDLARAAGLSGQSVRKYEAWGFLPPAGRSASGYRCYEERHLHALRTARVLIAGYGWQSAREIMRQVHQGDVAGALARVDACHAALHQKRCQVEQTLAALEKVSERVPQRLSPRPWRSRLYAGEAARRIGVRVSAIRFWEQQGLLQPQRDPENRYRLYDEEQFRRLQVVALLREAGYSFEAIRTVLAELAEERPEPALSAIRRRQSELTEATYRSIAGSGALWGYLQATGKAPEP